MKKMLLLAAAMLLTSVTSFAEWTKPAAPESQAVVKDGTTAQYLWNTAGGFFLAANDWNTRTSLSATKGYKVKFASTTETTGLETYALIDSLEVTNTGAVGTAWLKTFCDSSQSIWADNNNGANADYWLITPAEGNTFMLSNANIAEGDYLGVANDFSLNSRLYLQSYFEAQSPAVEATYTWYSVAPEVYEAYIVKSKQYEAAMSLKTAIESAEEKYPGIDLTAQKAVYDNENSTVEELDVQTATIPAAIASYLVDQLKKATADAPMDATGFITNPSFETGNYNGWTVTKSDDTGAYPTSNGTYYVDNADGKYIFNIWAWGYPIRQKITGLPSGVYQLSAGVCSSDDCTNVYITANGYMTNRNGGYIDGLYKAVTLEANAAGSKQQHLTTGTLYFVVEADSMTIGAVGCSADGVTYTANGKWWYKCDNFQLKYYGTSADAYKLLQNEDFGSKDVDPEETFATKQLVQDYITARDDFYKGTEADQIYNGLKGMFMLADSLDANIAAYAAYQKEVEDAQKQTEDKEGVYVDLLAEYLSETLEPGAAPESVEGYVFKNGSYPYIAENEQLTTTEIKEETSFVQTLVGDMLKNTAVDGTDFTSALINPTFADANGTGWTWEKTRVTNFRNTGGYTAFPCAEAWHSSYLLFDVYQDVAGVPDGLYEISANAFYRPNGNGAGNVDPENQTINAFIYMNDFESAVKHIGADGISVDDWATFSTETACGQAITTDNWYYQENLGLYTPNSMSGASQAFERGMYKQTVYGLVEGGKMRLGIHKTVDDSKEYANDQWCLWSNFKLTYRAKNAEAVSSVCETLIANAKDIMDNQSEKLVSECANALSDATNTAENAQDNNAKYEALKGLNAAIKNAKEAINLYDETDAALTSLNDAIGVAYGAGQSEELLTEATNYCEENSNALTELRLSVDEMKAIIAAVPEKLVRLQIIGDWTKAVASNDESWVDLSPLFNSNFDAGNIDGWTDTYTQGNHGYQSNAIYTNVDNEEITLNKFVEAWRSGNAALEDGKISTTIGATGYSFMPYLPIGTYTLQADVNSKNQADETITGGAFLFVTVGSDTIKVESPTTSVTAVQRLSLDFNVATEDCNVELGIMTQGTGYNWIGADNFKLIIKNYGEETAIATVAADQRRNTSTMIYNLAGQRISKLRKGVNIVGGKKVLK